MTNLICVSSTTTLHGPARRVWTTVQFGVMRSGSPTDIDVILKLDLRPEEATKYVVGERYTLTLTPEKK